MKPTKRFTLGRMLRGTLVGLVGCVILASATAVAQTGDNAVFNSSGTCSACAKSTAFIDATVFIGKFTSPDFCSVVNYVLSPGNHVLPANSAVIDARGLNSSNVNMTCPTTQPSPWYGISSPIPPSTILLPAGTISIPSTWFLPSNTHLIGEGDGVPSGSSTTVNTTIEAVNPFVASPGDMIQFGSSTLCSSACSGISIEKLILDGQGQSINGIVNANAGDDSYVDHVSLYQIRGTGLLVESGATNSGPYTNILFDTSSTYQGASSTVCAQILSVSGGTRGIHGLTCRTYTNDPPAAVLLDSSNNSIEDVTIVGFYDGILVGSNATAQNNVLLNIVGDTDNQNLTPINVVHISGNNSATSDLSIMGIANRGTGGGEWAIKDDLSGPHLPDTYVGMYALGNTGGGGFYSRFTTSPNAPTWVAGQSAPSFGTTGCTQGSLYSCIGSFSGSGSNCNYMGGSTYYALWACAYKLPGPVLTWLPVK